MQELKQKGEYAFSLSSQVEARVREAQHQEKKARDAEAESLRLAQQLEDTQNKLQVLLSPSKCSSVHVFLAKVPHSILL